MVPPPGKRLSAFDLVEGFHLSQALFALSRTGVLNSLNEAFGVSELASKHRVDRGILEAALKMLAARTGLIVHKKGKYSLTHEYDVYARFLIHQYLGAYGKSAIALDRILRRPSLAATLIDHREHAKAFDERPALSSIIVADLIVQLGLNHVLDVGCGTGLMLLDLTTRVTKFVGWGLDLNPSMCAAARKRVAASPTGRIAIFRGDCRNPSIGIPVSVVNKVRTIAAASLANEFFTDETSAIAWLSEFKRIFPDRTMLIADYYGRLGKVGKALPREIAFHDFVQVISGQGVPPSNHSAWKKIYRAAGCTLIHVVEDRDASFFVHLLRL